MGMMLECAPVTTINPRTASNLMQSPFWAAYKAEASGWNPKYFHYTSEYASGCLLTLEKTLSNGFTAVYTPWAPDSPLREEDQGPFLETLSGLLVSYFPASTVFIRYDLVWESPYDVEENAELYNFDGRPPPKVREMRMNFGTENWRLRKAPTDILPPDTVILPLHETVQSLYNRMKPKTRYNIRLSEKKDVSVYDSPASDLRVWYNLYEETTRRQGLTCHPQSDFESLFNAANVATNREGFADVRLLMAYKNSEPIAGIIVAMHKTHAIYLYGASSGRYRNLMAGYALQWKAINLAKLFGCEYYDMFGVSPFYNPSHPMNCLYRFKMGFGGIVLHRRGCWDFPVNGDAYETMIAHETLGVDAQGYYV